MRKNEAKYILGKVEKTYDLEKLNIIKIELFEIANRYRRYQHLTKHWCLKPLYGLVYCLCTFIAEFEAKSAA